jgi:stearoyl-CoA desaturase (delta-9 desaturase)
LNTVIRWFDTSRGTGSEDESVDWLRIVPFLVLHAGCLAVWWVGWSGIALTVALASYAVRAFAITAFFHRGLAHRAFRTGRVVQFFFAFLGTAATQRGPLWWVAHHRQHHAHADTGRDPHDATRGFWWSHMGWFLCRAAFDTRVDRVPDLVRFAELRWLNRFDLVPPLVYAVAMFVVGEALRPLYPQTGGWQMLVWGYVVATVALMHATFLVNSVGHRHGRRAYRTRDGSRNSWWLAMITLGEGWHNNHHRHSGSARLGLRRWELDPAHAVLRLMASVGLVRDLDSLIGQIPGEGLRAGSRGRRTRQEVRRQHARRQGARPCPEFADRGLRRPDFRRQQL